MLEIINESSTYTKKYKCPFCSFKSDRKKLVHHIDRNHEELIPQDSTALRMVFNIVNKKDHGTCIICKGESPWNEQNGRYDRICQNPACMKAYKDMIDQRMINMHGVRKLTSSPEHQEKMLAGRKISGTYKWSDGTEKSYTGSFERNALEFLDSILECHSWDVQTPGPVINYEYNGETHFYISDIYYIPYNLIIEIKDGGNNPNNREMREYREKQIAKETQIVKDKQYNYLRLTNNNFSQLLEIFAELKMAMQDANDEKIIRIHEHMAAFSNGMLPVEKKQRLYLAPYMMNNVFAGACLSLGPTCDQLITINSDTHLLEQKQASFLADKEYKLYAIDKYCKDNIIKEVYRTYIEQTEVDNKYLMEVVSRYTHEGVFLKEEPTILDRCHFVTESTISNILQNQIFFESVANLDNENSDYSIQEDCNGYFALYKDGNRTASVKSIDLLKEYLNESKREDFFISSDNIEYNMDKFNSGEINVCFITGYSGGGKTTIANELAKDKNTYLLELDIIMWQHKYSDEEIKNWGNDKGLAWKFLSGPGKIYRQPKEFLKLVNKENYDAYAYPEFVKFILDYASKHKNEKFVIEGVWLFDYMKPSIAEDYAVIIVGTSAFVSNYRFRMRTYGRHNIDPNTLKVKRVGKDLFDPKNYDFDEDKVQKLNAWKDYYKKLSISENRYYNSDTIISEENIMHEKMLFNQKDLYYNKDKFDNGEINLCFITGLSGSGKSTMASNMKNSNTIHCNLDGLINHYDNEEEMKKWEGGELFVSYMNSSARPKYKDSDGETTDEDAEAWVSDITNGFVDWIISYAKSHKDKKFIVEGIYLYWVVKPNKLADYAVYVKGTSALISSWRCSKRDANDVAKSKLRGFKDALKLFLSKSWKTRIDLDKKVQEFRNFFYKRIPINEGVSSKLNKDYSSKEIYSLSKFKNIKLSAQSLKLYKDKCKNLRHIRENNNGYLYLDDNNVVAVIATEAKEDSHIWITALEIMSHYKGHKLSKQLLDIATKELKATHLSVNKNNDVAIRLYENYGFKTYQETDTMYFMSTKKQQVPINEEPIQERYNFDPPLTINYLPDHLKEDPVHKWRALEGIELIHKEPTLKELKWIWKNWKKMPDHLKEISDKKSIELFGINNEDHYNELLKDYDEKSGEPLNELSLSDLNKPPINQLYRCTCNGQGIYDALKKKLVVDMKQPELWQNFLKSSKNKWLKNPGESIYSKRYGSYEAYFTKDGIDKFKSTILSDIEKYIDKNDIKFTETDMNKLEDKGGTIVYSDKHQIVYGFGLKENAIVESKNQDNLDSLNINSPEELSKWMKYNIKYKEYTKLMSAQEVFENKAGSCHDQVRFEEIFFKKFNLPYGKKFFIEYNDGEEQGGKTHTFLWYKDNDKYYWFENAWGGQEGIHGPYNSLSDLCNEVKELDLKNSKYSNIEFAIPKKLTTGMSLSQYVDKCLNESYTIDTLPDKLYFASTNKMNTLSGRVFLTPYIGIASIFIAGRYVVHDYITEILHHPAWKSSFNCGYDEWDLPDNQLLKPLKMVHIKHNIVSLATAKPKIGTAKGYVHEIDISDLDKDSLSLFVTNDANREVIYNGTEPLKITKIIPHMINYEIRFDQSEVMQHGVGIVESSILKFSNNCLIISCFAGVGKNYAIEFFQRKGYVVNSIEKYRDFYTLYPTPNDYANAVKLLATKSDILFIPYFLNMHERYIKDAFNYYLVYPSKNCKSEYLKRFKELGFTKKQIDYLSDSWNDMIKDCQNHNQRIELDKNEYVSDALETLLSNVNKSSILTEEKMFEEDTVLNHIRDFCGKLSKWEYGTLL